MIQQSARSMSANFASWPDSSAPSSDHTTISVLVLAIVLLLETGFNCCFPLATRYLIDDGLLRRDSRALIATLIFLAIAAVAVALSA